MGAEENSQALSVKKGLLKEYLRSVFFALKSIAWQQWTSGLNCEEWIYSFFSSILQEEEPREVETREGRDGTTEDQLQSPLSTVSIHLLNIWLLAALAWYPRKWQVKAYWSPDRGLWYLSSSDIDRGTLTRPVYHLQTRMVLPALPVSRGCDKEPFCEQMNEQEILSTSLKAPSGEFFHDNFQQLVI